MFQPYPYQSECLSKLTVMRAEGAKKALVVMASGLGKTVTVALDAKQWFENCRGRILYMCHQNDILYQAKATFEAIFGHGRTYGFLHGSEKSLHAVDCLFASFQTMAGHLDVFDPTEFDYIVVDESHHSQAMTYRPVIEYFRSSFLLAVTATPDRRDHRNIREMYGQEVYFLPLDEALARGLVTPVDYRLMTDEVKLTDILAQVEEGKKLSPGYLNRKIFVPKRDDEVARIIAKQVSEFADPRIIIFCASINHCDHLASFIPDSFTLHSKIPDKERAVRLEMFRQGIVSTVLTVDAFNEGVDIPQANIIVFMRSTVSATVFLQQLGRGLRKATGKDRVMVLDFVGNCERVKMVYNLHESVKRDLERETADGRWHGGQFPPITLNVDHPGFVEQVIKVTDILERLRPKLVSDIPKLALEYSPKNMTPADRVVAGTARKLWWRCSKCGHEWQAAGAHRAREQESTGCPACDGKVVTASTSLAVTHPELAVEYSSKNPKLATEVKAGTNKRLWWLCSKCQYEWQAPGKRRVGGIKIPGTGCPSCAGKVVTQYNCLAVTHPELASEYSPKNPKLATEVKAGTNKKLWWICSKCSYEWQSNGNNRKNGNGCPACSNKVVNNKNNLTVTHPELAAQYSPKNEKPATEVIAGTNKKVWWACGKCRHEWQATGNSRKRGNGCPACGRKVKSNAIS